MIRARTAAWMPAAVLLAAALMFALVLKTQAGVLPSIPALTPAVEMRLPSITTQTKAATGGS